MLTALAAFLLGVSHPIASPTERPDAIRCDDGSPLYTPEGRPNWDCWLAGCTPHDDICWSDRLDHCFDEAGNDRGVCVYSTSRCDGVFSCYKLWFSCVGEYKCLESGPIVGCKKGTCTLADKPATPQSADSTEQGSLCLPAP